MDYEDSVVSKSNASNPSLSKLFEKKNIEGYIQSTETEESLIRMISSLLYASKFVKVGSDFYGFSLFQDRNSISQVIYLIIFSLHGSIFRTKICIKVNCERTIKLDSSFSSRPELKYNKKL